MIHGLPVVLWCFPFCFTFITITIRIHKISRTIIKVTLVPPTTPATRASDSPPPLPTNICQYLLITIAMIMLIVFDHCSYKLQSFTFCAILFSGELRKRRYAICCWVLNADSSSFTLTGVHPLTKCGTVCTIVVLRALHSEAHVKS